MSNFLAFTLIFDIAFLYRRSRCLSAANKIKSDPRHTPIFIPSPPKYNEQVHIILVHDEGSAISEVSFP